MYPEARSPALIDARDERHATKPLVHDMLNVFMNTDFSLATHQDLIEVSLVRPGDYLEFQAEIDLSAGLSTCPGADCGHETFKQYGCLPPARHRSV